MDTILILCSLYRWAQAGLTVTEFLCGVFAVAHIVPLAQLAVGFVRVTEGRLDNVVVGDVVNI
jgi:hypothetical protein